MASHSQTLNMHGNGITGVQGPGGCGLMLHQSLEVVVKLGNVHELELYKKSRNNFRGKVSQAACAFNACSR